MSKRVTSMGEGSASHDDIAPRQSRARTTDAAGDSASSKEAAMDRFEHVRLVFGEERFEAVRAAKVLVVGAGGVGCELLKNLVLVGFRDIVVLDLDTIDVSNLNRQFLFRQRHVGLSKARVAREAILEMNSDVTIEALHTRIQDPLFSPAYVAGFDVVLSALDNVEARIYLNYLCYTAGVGVIESGTHGYLGQSEPTIHCVTACYACSGVRRAKATYAVCTIRNTPDLPIHCIAWAKHLYAVFFGPLDEDNLLIDLRRDLEAHLPPVGGNASSSPSSSSSFSLDADDAEALAAAEAFALAAFQRLFVTEVDAQREVKDRWVTRAPPEHIALHELFDVPVATVATASVSTSTGAAVTNAEYDAASKCAVAAAARAYARAHSSTAAAQQSVQSPAYDAAHFLAAAAAIARGESGPLGGLTFDKDDDLAVQFVAAAANLRMRCYGIAPVSEFDAKGMAGAIVHALATTNAVVSGLAVKNAAVLAHARAVRRTALMASPASLQGEFGRASAIEARCRSATVTNWFPSLLQSIQLQGPGAECFCARPALVLTANTRTLTLRALLTDVFAPLGLQELAVDRLSGEPRYFGLLDDYLDSHEDWVEQLVAARARKQKQQAGDSPAISAPADADPVVPGETALSRPLAALGIADGALLTVRDNECDLSIIVRVRHCESVTAKPTDSSITVAAGADPAARAPVFAGRSDWGDLIEAQLQLRADADASWSVAVCSDAGARSGWSVRVGTVTEDAGAVTGRHFLRLDGSPASPAEYLTTSFAVAGPLTALPALRKAAATAAARKKESEEAAAAAEADKNAKRGRGAFAAADTAAVAAGSAGSGSAADAVALSDDDEDDSKNVVAEGTSSAAVSDTGAADKKGNDSSSNSSIGGGSGGGGGVISLDSDDD